MYIDESGDEGEYRFKNGQINTGSSKYFTIAGIIVDSVEKEKIEKSTRSLIKRYFKSIQLSDKFKLHYHPLLHNRYPYDQLSRQQCKQLEDEVFHIIKKSDLQLLSATIDLEKHCKKYDKPHKPKPLTLLLLLNRFQNFLEKRDGTGRAIYEGFGRKERLKTEYAMRRLSRDLNVTEHIGFQNIRRRIENGDPKKYPILQLADFFAYATWRRSTSSYHVADRWESIKGKYYKLDGTADTTGNIEI